MSAGKIFATVALLGAAGVGFWIVKSKVTPSGSDYRVRAYLGGGGQWFAKVFVNGKPTGPLIGPVPSEEDANKQGAAYLEGLGAVAFYTLHSQEMAPGKFDWFFSGWSRGSLVSADNGPYASEAAATTAGSAWAAAAARAGGA